MIAAYSVIFLLALAMGWRGERFFWRRMRWKWLAVAIVVGVVATTAFSPIDGLITTPLTYLFVALIGVTAFFLGAVARLIFRRRN